MSRLIDADVLMATLGITDMDCVRCAWYSKSLRRCKRGGDFEDACCAIENAPTIEQPHWIPVTERMPEYGTEVVTINKDDEYEINHVIDEEDGEWFYNGAVAWMPLPPIYIGQTRL